jgi:hypothetical protein
MLKQINLNRIHEESAEVREAVAFYTASTIFPIQCSPEQRRQHYSVLEQAGYIEQLNDSILESLCGNG